MKCKCATCPSHACYTKRVNCTGVPHEEVKAAYTEEELKLMQAAAYVEGTFYSNICRLQETAEFAKAMGYKKLGMAFCIGLNAEARYIAKYFELFISCGLCVGHDAIFNMNCPGPVTNLVVKDRLLGHNPLAAIYSRYWKRKLGIMDEGEI